MKKFNNYYNHIPCVSIYTVTKMLIISLFFEVLFFLPLTSFSQTAGNGTERVEILYADSLSIVNDPNGETRSLFGNVRLKHKNTLMWCDKAIQYAATNYIEAFGKVKIIEGDTITVSGDTLQYYGDVRLAIMTGNKALLEDANRTLASRKLEYNILNATASYKTPGETFDKENRLSSKMGTYDMRTKMYTYQDNVKLVNKKYTLKTDTLEYDSNTKWAYFKGNTTIENKDGVLRGTKGQHNTNTGQSIFENRTSIDNPKYTLTGDSLFYDEPLKQGFAKGRVEIVAKKDSTVLHGDEGFYDGVQGFSKVYGRAKVQRIMQMDTLFVRGDTLYSFENKVDSSQFLIANRQVQILKSDFQAVCDSLTYSSKDSVFRFFKKPILWGQGNQLEADSITAWMRNGKIDKMFLKTNAFVISEDTLIQQHNQVKGRTITSLFDNKGRIREVFVDGNGESAYYAVDDKQTVIGLNRVESGKMNLFFRNDQVYRIAFIGRPDGKLIPPHDIKTDQRFLSGFKLKMDQKPTRKSVTWQE